MSLERLRRYSMPSEVIRAIQDFVEAVKSRYSDAEIYLFGSYAKGTWIEDSDIDIIVVSRGFEGMSLEERARILRMMASKKLPFQILAYTPKEFKEISKRSIIIQDAMEYWIKIL